MDEQIRPLGAREPIKESVSSIGRSIVGVMNGWSLWGDPGITALNYGVFWRIAVREGGGRFHECTFVYAV